MNHNLRCVLDTNVIVSALLFKNSQPRQALDKVRKHGKLLMSTDVWAEIQLVIVRPKFDPYVTSTERELFLTGLLSISEFTEIHEQIQICRDPKDDKFLELAVNGNASVIVTGDQDLLILNPFREVQILTTANFLSLSEGM